MMGREFDRETLGDRAATAWAMARLASADGTGRGLARDISVQLWNATATARARRPHYGPTVSDLLAARGKNYGPPAARARATARLGRDIPSQLREHGHDVLTNGGRA